MESTPGMQPDPQPSQLDEDIPSAAAEPTPVEPVIQSSPPAAAVTPDPAPAPEPPAPEPEPPAPESPIASTVSVPADPGANDAEGGEWHLLMEKLTAWLGDAKLMEVWEQSQRPLKLVGIGLVLLVMLQLTGAVLGTLDAIPLLPRLLQLLGLVYLSLFASRRLIRRDERTKLIDGVKGAWNSFTGKS